MSWISFLAAIPLGALVYLLIRWLATEVQSKRYTKLPITHDDVYSSGADEIQQEWCLNLLDGDLILYYSQGYAQHVKAVCNVLFREILNKKGEPIPSWLR